MSRAAYAVGAVLLGISGAHCQSEPFRAKLGVLVEAEPAVGVALAVRAVPTCEVNPYAVALGEQLSISATSLESDWQVRIEVVARDRTQSFNALPDDTGGMEVQTTASAIGDGAVLVYHVGADDEQLKAACTFHVLESPDSCVPTTCQAAEADCGVIADGCGGELDCGGCAGPLVCGGGGQANTCGCTPTSCLATGAECGIITDGCGGTLDCGGCRAPQACGGGGTANACGEEPCVPLTCTDQGAHCGDVSDGCGDILYCGDCSSPDSCGGGGVANQCGCRPSTCAREGVECGTASDGCGGTLHCGGCGGTETCGGGGVPGVCGVEACQPRTCDDADAECGAVADGCGGTLDCGGCSGEDTCGGGGEHNVCGGSFWPSSWADLEDRVLDLVNERRAAGAVCGNTSYPPVGPVVTEPRIRAAARLHSEDMAQQDYFAHASQDGRSFSDRMRDAGWLGSCSCGENIAAGYPDPEWVVAGWMDSPGHCVNIMNGNYGVMGVGYAHEITSSFGNYWTQDFAAW